jgi:elongator complex protein 3
MDIEKKFIDSLLKDNITDLRRFFALQRKFSKQYRKQFIRKDKLIKKYHTLLEDGKIKENKHVEELLKIRSIRSLSGVVSISVLTKPFPCPGHCLYCPNQPGMPKSYLREEPAVQRAILNDFDPYKQTQSRLKALEAIGHKTDKITIRIVGGTWSFYDRKYQSWFIKRIFQAVNDYPQIKSGPISLIRVQKINETAERRIVEMGIETRQEYVTAEEIKRLKSLGVTKVELGVQSIYDDVLEKNNRNNVTADTIRATKILKDAGFKVSYQIMLNLYGSSIDQDRDMFDELFSNPDYLPDHIKIYPLAVLKEAPLYKIYQKKKFKIYTDDELKDLITDIKQKVPYTCRVERVIRDIPAAYIVAGCKSSNMRQLVHQKMATKGLSCKCIRCREIRRNSKLDKLEMFSDEFRSSGATEVFISVESKDRANLYGILRLRLLNRRDSLVRVLKDAAIIRDFHIFGQLVAISEIDTLPMRHKTIGQQLITQAEKIAKDRGYKKIAFTSGIGLRIYFANLGYRLHDSYMIKELA